MAPARRTWPSSTSWSEQHQGGLGVAGDAFEHADPHPQQGPGHRHHRVGGRPGQPGQADRVGFRGAGVVGEHVGHPQPVEAEHLGMTSGV
jgi:hypothetical protein